MRTDRPAPKKLPTAWEKFSAPWEASSEAGVRSLRAGWAFPSLSPGISGRVCFLLIVSVVLCCPPASCGVPEVFFK